MDGSSIALPTVPTQAGYDVLPIDELFVKRTALERRLNALLASPAILEARQDLEIVNTALFQKAVAAAQVEFDRDGKADGSKQWIIAPGVRARAKIDKRVEWDQAQLKAVAGTLTWPEVQHLFKIEFSVSEKIYSALMPGPLKVALERARTTRRGDMRVTLDGVAPSSEG